MWRVQQNFNAPEMQQQHWAFKVCLDLAQITLTFNPSSCHGTVQSGILKWRQFGHNWSS